MYILYMYLNSRGILNNFSPSAIALKRFGVFLLWASFYKISHMLSFLLRLLNCIFVGSLCN